MIKSKHQLRHCPEDLQLLVGRRRLGGIAYVYVWLECFYEFPLKTSSTLDSMRTLSWFVSYRRLSPQFQFSLSAAALGMYLCGTNQGRTAFICSPRVPICLSFNSQQGAPLFDVSVSGIKKLYCSSAPLRWIYELANLIFKLFQLHNFLDNLLFVIN